MKAYLWSDRVLDADHGDAGHVGQDVRLILPVGFGGHGEVAVRHANGAQAVARHRLDHLLHHLIPVGPLEVPQLPSRVQDGGAPGRYRKVQEATHT